MRRARAPRGLQESAKHVRPLYRKLLKSTLRVRSPLCLKPRRAILVDVFDPNPATRPITNVSEELLTVKNPRSNQIIHACGNGTHKLCRNATFLTSDFAS